MIPHNWVIRKPFLKLSYPVGKCREWSYDHERTTDSFGQKMRNQGNALYGLAELKKQKCETLRWNSVATISAFLTYPHLIS